MKRKVFLRFLKKKSSIRRMQGPTLCPLADTRWYPARCSGNFRDIDLSMSSLARTITTCKTYKNKGYINGVQRINRLSRAHYKQYLFIGNGSLHWNDLIHPFNKFDQSKMHPCSVLLSINPCVYLPKWENTIGQSRTDMQETETWLIT
jgi:hypothetical protein